MPAAWRPGMAADSAQLAVLLELTDHAAAGHPGDSMLGRLAARFRDPVAVLACTCGEVGRGKTFLVDLLFEQTQCAEAPPDLSLHGEVHARLRVADTADTLAVVARDLSADLRLLVLDEFFVGDIGDAMIPAACSTS
jgi:cell division protein ZapE